VKDIFLNDMIKPISLLRSLVPIYNLPITPSGSDDSKMICGCWKVNRPLYFTYFS